MFSDLSNGAITAAIAGSQSVSTNTAQELTRTIIQTFRGHSIEDNQNDPMYVVFCCISLAFEEFFEKDRIVVMCVCVENI